MYISLAREKIARARLLREARAAKSKSLEKGAKTEPVMLKSTRAAYHTHTVGPADVIEFTTSLEANLKSYSIGISPVQDLHGYDSPWPAGGGKNLLNINRSSGVPNPNTYNESPRVMDTGHCFPGMTRNNYYLLSAVSNISISETDIQFEISNGGYGIAFPVSAKPQTSYTISFDNVSNGKVSLGYYSANWGFLAHKDGETPPYTFQTPEDCAYITVLVTAQIVGTAHVKNIQLELGSTATAYSPYSNICPITGWTGAEVTRTGKNLVKGRIEDSSIGTTGVIGLNASYDMCYGGVVEGETYIVTTDENQLVCGFYAAEPASGSESYDSQRIVQYSKTFTAPITGYVAFRVLAGYATPQLELGSTATAYEPYTGNTYSITFPDSAGTVYGGTLTVQEDGTGELVVDRVTKTLSGGEDEDWILAATYNGSNFKHTFFRIDLETRKSNSQTTYGVVSNWAETRQVSDAVVYDGWTMRGQAADTKVFYILTPTSAEATIGLTEFKAMLAETPLQISYILATPLTYTLTAPQVSTLLGSNVLWADAGEMSAEYYYRDTTKPTPKEKALMWWRDHLMWGVGVPRPDFWKE